MFIVVFFSLCVFFFCFYFFFQAEDGIRDLVRSRGLGDVYKRQVDVRLWLCLKHTPRNEKILLKIVAIDLTRVIDKIARDRK